MSCLTMSHDHVNAEGLLQFDGHMLPGTHGKQDTFLELLSVSQFHLCSVELETQPSAPIQGLWSMLMAASAFSMA